MGGAVLLSPATYATCASDGVVKFWDHDRVREERLCPSGGSALASVGGHSVIAGHADGACRLWDARSDVCALDMGPRDSTDGRPCGRGGGAFCGFSTRTTRCVL